MGKRGRNLKFWLSPEDEAILKMNMEHSGFSDRGPYLMHLITQKEEVDGWRREAALEAMRLIKRFQIRNGEFDLTENYIISS